MSFREGGWVAIGKVRGLSEVGEWLQRLSEVYQKWLNAYRGSLTEVFQKRLNGDSGGQRNI